MSFLLTLFISTALGLLSGLGIGGGSLLILWLTLVCKENYSAAKYINLLFFLPPAAITTIVRLLRRQLSLKRILPAVVAGVISAAVFTVLSSSWDVAFLRKLFGALLFFTAWRELRYKKKAAQ